MGADGTPAGLKPSSAAFSFVDALLNTLTQDSTFWWSGPWPLLHLKCEGIAYSEVSYLFEMTIDLLGSMTICSFGIDSSADDALTDTQIDNIAALGVEDFLSDAFPAEGVLLNAAAYAYLALDTYLFFSTCLPSPTVLVGFSILVAVFTIAFYLGISALVDGVNSGRISPGAAIFVL